MNKIICLLVVLLCAYVLEAQKIHTVQMHKEEPSPENFLHVSTFLSQKYGVNSKNAGNTDLPMGGSIYPIGIFYIQVQIGTPAQTFNVAVDSGSCTLLVPGKDCEGCTSDIIFHPSQSSTVQTIPCPSFTWGCDQCADSGQCSFYNSYQTCNLSAITQVCSVGGLVWADVFALGGLQGSSIPFGTINYQTSNFQQFFYIDGVLGFACNSQWNHDTPLQALVDAGEIQDMFALCFDQSRQGGIMTLGGADPNLYKGQFAYTPFTGDGTQLYTINFNDVQVAGQSIGISSDVFGDVVVDSGTNVLLLPTPAFQAVKSALQQYCQTTPLVGICKRVSGPHATLFNNQCFKMTQQERASFPPIGITLPGTGSSNVQLTMTHRNYILEQVANSGMYCLGIIDTGDDGFTIIGDTTMEPYVTLFDRVNNQLGFAVVNPDTCVYKPSN